MKFIQVESQKEIDKLCEYYHTLDSHLFFPRSGNVQSVEKYSFEINGKHGVKISRFIRNACALEKLLAFINQLDNYFIGIEYFQDNIYFERKKEIELPQKFKDIFFISIITDSLRSSLDIFAKFLGWYFDLAERDEIGFNYKKLIQPIDKISNKIAKQLKITYKSKEYTLIKELRDTDKHIGKNQNKIKFERSIEKFNFEFKRYHPVNFNDFEKSSINLFKMIMQLLSIAIDECILYELGYNSKKDDEVIEDEKGLFVML